MLQNPAASGKFCALKEIIIHSDGTWGPWQGTSPNLQGSGTPKFAGGFWGPLCWWGYVADTHAWTLGPAWVWCFQPMSESWCWYQEGMTIYQAPERLWVIIVGYPLIFEAEKALAHLEYQNLGRQPSSKKTGKWLGLWRGQILSGKGKSNRPRWQGVITTQEMMLEAAAALYRSCPVTAILSTIAQTLTPPSPSQPLNNHWSKRCFLQSLRNPYLALIY